MEISQIRQALDSISEPTRMAIVNTLADQDYSVGELMRTLNYHASQPAFSQHLQVLRASGVVAMRVDAQWRIYSLNRKMMRDISMHFLKLSQVPVHL